MSNNTNLKTMDYTEPCLDILNRIIDFSHFMPVMSADDVATKAPRLYSSLNGQFYRVWRLHNGSPREVYELAFKDDPDMIKSVELKWATTWAKNASIISHHGPAGTTGWAIYRNKHITREELGILSPFNIQDLSDALSEAMRFSNALRVQEFKKQQDALSRASKIENELKAEKKKQKLSKQFTWS